MKNSFFWRCCQGRILPFFEAAHIAHNMNSSKVCSISYHRSWWLSPGHSQWRKTHSLKSRFKLPLSLKPRIIWPIGFVTWAGKLDVFLKKKCPERWTGVVQNYEWSLETMYHITSCWVPIGHTEFAFGSMIWGATTSRWDSGNARTEKDRNASMLVNAWRVNMIVCRWTRRRKGREWTWQWEPNEWLC